MNCSSKNVNGHGVKPLKPPRLWEGSWDYFPNGNAVNPFEKPKGIPRTVVLQGDSVNAKETIKVPRRRSLSKDEHFYLTQEDIEHISRKSKTETDTKDITKVREKTPEGFKRFTLKQILELENWKETQKKPAEDTSCKNTRKDTSYKRRIFYTKTLQPHPYKNMDQISSTNSKPTTISNQNKANSKITAIEGKDESVNDCQNQHQGIFQKIEYPYMTEIPDNHERPNFKEMIERIKSLGPPKTSSTCAIPVEKIFRQACVEGDVESILRLLYEGQVNPNDTLYQSWTGIQYGCYNGQTAVVRLLLTLGADPSFKKNKDDLDVIMSVASTPYNEDSGPYECAKLIIHEGVDVNSVMQNGLSPLLLAVRRGHIKIAKLLLDNGANVDHLDEDNKRTAINWATYRNNYEMVQLLLDYKANPTIKNSNGETAYYVAINAGNKKLANFLAFSQTAKWRLGLSTDNLKTSKYGSLKIIEYAKTHNSESGENTYHVQAGDENSKVRPKEDHKKGTSVSIGKNRLWISMMVTGLGVLIALYAFKK